MAVPIFDGWKKEIVAKFFNDSHGTKDNENDDEQKTLVKREHASCNVIEDGTNNISINSISNERDTRESTQTVEDIIGDILNMLGTDLEADDKDDPYSAMDASNVPFACQDIRTKPGYVKPPEVEKPKAVVKERKIIDTFDHHIVLALPGESVFIPDITEETWREASDEELGKELADKLQEEKSDKMVALVKIMGRGVVLDYFWKTQNVEDKGGLVIMNGSRRRTSGGVLFQLLRVSKDDAVKDKFDQFLKEEQYTSRKPEEKTIEQKKQLDKQIEDYVKEQKTCSVNESNSDEYASNGTETHENVESTTEDETKLGKIEACVEPSCVE